MSFSRTGVEPTTRPSTETTAPGGSEWIASIPRYLGPFPAAGRRPSSVRCDARLTARLSVRARVRSGGVETPAVAAVGVASRAALLINAGEGASIGNSTETAAWVAGWTGAGKSTTGMFCGASVLLPPENSRAPMPSPKAKAGISHFARLGTESGRDRTRRLAPAAMRTRSVRQIDVTIRRASASRAPTTLSARSWNPSRMGLSSWPVFSHPRHPHDRHS